MAESSRRTPRELAETFAKEEGLIFLEASAKTGENVNELFEQVGEYLHFFSFLKTFLFSFFWPP